MTANKNITLDIITAIVLKAMNKKFAITAFSSNHMSEITIYDENKNNKFDFQINIYDEDEKEFSFHSDNGSIQNIKIESESFILKFKLLVEDCINYSKTMTLKDIETFLSEDEEENKPKDINDLDSEDD